MSRRSLARSPSRALRTVLFAGLVVAVLARVVYVQTYWSWNDRDEAFRAAAAKMGWPVDDMQVRGGGSSSSFLVAEERRSWVTPGDDPTRYEIVLARGLLAGLYVRRASVGPAE
ncbi:MAG: hypothetical protein AAF957_29025 [Planctomycetota bacterium]